MNAWSDKSRRPEILLPTTRHLRTNGSKRRRSIEKLSRNHTFLGVDESKKEYNGSSAQMRKGDKQLAPYSRRRTLPISKGKKIIQNRQRPSYKRPGGGYPFFSPQKTASRGKAAGGGAGRAQVPPNSTNISNHEKLGSCQLYARCYPLSAGLGKGTYPA